MDSYTAPGSSGSGSCASRRRPNPLRRMRRHGDHDDLPVRCRWKARPIRGFRAGFQRETSRTKCTAEWRPRNCPPQFLDEDFSRGFSPDRNGRGWPYYGARGAQWERLNTRSLPHNIAPHSGHSIVAAQRVSPGFPGSDVENAKDRGLEARAPACSTTSS
jgi:hypothetical protein